MTGTRIAADPENSAGLSPGLVGAKNDLVAIERRIDRGTAADPIDYLGVIAAALVSIATSLETRPI